MGFVLGKGGEISRKAGEAPMGSFASLQVNHLRCLHEFAEAQATYYAQCYQYMLDLQKQLGR